MKRIYRSSLRELHPDEFSYGYLARAGGEKCSARAGSGAFTPLRVWQDPQDREAYFPSCWSVNVVRKRRQGAAGRGRLSSNCAVWFPHFFISDNSLFIRWPNATVPEDGVNSTLKELEKARTDGENAKASEAIAWRKLSKLEAVLQRAKEEAGRAPRRILGPPLPPVIIRMLRE